MLSPWSGASAMPMLALTSIAWPLTRNGGSSACWIFQTTVAAPARSVAPTGRIPNSSPPSRAIVSPVAQAADEPLGDELEQHVAVLVAERVVDVLELVEVHDQQRQRLARPQRRRGSRASTRSREQHAVGQAGEVVVQRLVLQRLGVGLALGDVAQAADVDRAAPRARTSLRLELHRERRAVPAPADGLGGAPACRPGAGSAAWPRRAWRSRRGASGRPSSRTAARSPPARCSRTARSAARLNDSITPSSLSGDDPVRDVVEHRARVRLAVAELRPSESARARAT